MSTTTLFIESTCTSGMCPSGCTIPICYHPRAGDCSVSSASSCLFAHVYPPEPVPFDGLVSMYEETADVVGESALKTELSESKQVLEGTRYFRPDWRFFVGAGLAAVGGYSLWKLRKKGH